MTRATLSEARQNLPELANRAGYKGERIVLERRGKPVAVLISVEDLELLERLEDMADYREAIRIELDARANGETPISLDEAKRRLGL